VKISPLPRVALALLAMVIPASAQQTSPPSAPYLSDQEKPPAAKPADRQVGGLKFVDVAQVTVVNVNVTVTDKKGPVLDLKPSDFTVLQDGREQPLTNFALYTEEGEEKPHPPTAVAAPTAGPTPIPAPEEEGLPPAKPERRFVAIYIDSENILPFNRNRVINSMVDWVGKYMTHGDQVMVVSYQRSVKILQPFTTDPDEVASALRATKRFTGGRTDAENGRRQVEDYIDRNADSNPSTITQAVDDASSFAREQRNDLQFTIGAIKELVTMMSGLPGRRAVIYVSDGLPMNPGMELYYEIEDRYHSPTVLSLAHDNDASDLFRGLISTATAAGVTFYTIDARGLESEMGIEAENRVARSNLAASVMQSNYQDSLTFMAHQTGGMAILNSNDPSVGLEKIAADLKTYYSLGYRLIPTGEDRFHRIEVKLKSHPGYRLNYRHTFIEKSLASTIGDRVVSGLEFDLDDNPMGIELKTGKAVPANGERWTLPVEIHVPIDKVALIPDGDQLVGYVMCYYAARDNGGKQSDLQRTEEEIRVPKADYDRARRQYYTVATSLLLEPGNYRISVGVRDELTNQAGYAATRQSVHPEAK
jgi:VWFA-related protein